MMMTTRRRVLTLLTHNRNSNVFLNTHLIGYCYLQNTKHTYPDIILLLVGIQFNTIIINYYNFY